jgi:hypothetical protein
VDEPLGGDAEGADTFGDPVGDDEAAADETVELDLGDEAATDADAATDGEVEADVETEAETETDVAAEGEAAEGDEVAGGGAAAPAGEPVVITFTQAAEGVAVQNVQGAEDAEAVAATDQPNPDLNLTVGQRYEFTFDGEGDLVFFDAANQPLLTSAGAEGTFAQDADVAAETEEGRVAFTLTEELAQEIDHYAVGPEEQGGTVNVN